MIWSACLHPCEWREISERWVLLSISAEPVIVSHIVCPAPQTYRKSIIVCFFSSNAKLSFHCKQKWYLGETNFDLNILFIRLNSPLALSWISSACGRGEEQRRRFRLKLHPSCFSPQSSHQPLCAHRQVLLLNFSLHRFAKIPNWSFKTSLFLRYQKIQPCKKMKIQKWALLLCTEGKAMGRKTTQVNLTSPENQILNKYRGRI